MIEHVNIMVSDVVRSRAFYDRVLATLGVKSLNADDEGALYGVTDAFFVIGRGAFKRGSGPTPVHVGFRAYSHHQVDAFHAAGLAAGGGDNGPPGLRPHYGKYYYACFVRDPDGHNIEAVCQRPSL